MKTQKNLFYCLLMLSFVLSTGASASAQTAEKKSLTLDGAERVIAAAKAYATQVKAPGGVIAVVDAGGNLMALERLDGTFAAGANISIGKARTAVLFQKPTKVFEDIINKGRTAMAALPTRFSLLCKAEFQLFSMDRLSAVSALAELPLPLKTKS